MCVLLKSYYILDRYYLNNFKNINHLKKKEKINSIVIC